MEVKKLDKSRIQDILALTSMQEGMLFHYLEHPPSPRYFEQLSLAIRGEVSEEVFEKAWNFVIETNDVLRTVFRWEEVENPVQIVLKRHTFQPGYYDIAGKTFNEKKKQLEKIKAEDRKERFDLREAPFRVTLCKTGEALYEMIVSHHHILYDGWSNSILLREFFRAYDDLRRQKEPLPPRNKKTGFKAFIRWISRQDTGKQEAFWKEYLMLPAAGGRKPLFRS